MARPCKICSHPKRADIEEAITTRNYTALRKYGFSRHNTQNHRPHIVLTPEAKALVQSHNARLDQVSLAESLFNSLAKVEKWIESDDQGFALAASREHREKLKALFVMLGETEKNPAQLPILKHPELPALVAKLKECLRDTPGAMDKFSERLRN